MTDTRYRGYTDQSEHLARNGSTATLEWWVPWESRISTGASLVGGLQVVGGSPIIFPAARYADIPGLQCLSVTTRKATDVKTAAELAASPPGTVGWKSAILTAQFGIPENSENNDSLPALGEIAVDVSAQAFVVPKGSFKWTSGPSNGKALNDDDLTPSITFPQIDLTLSVFNVSELDLPGIADVAGKVNNSTFLNFDANRVLFVGAQSQRKVTVDGNNAWTLNFKFSVLPSVTHWNKVYHSKSGTWQTVSPKPYQTGDLASFFGG